VPRHLQHLNFHLSGSLTLTSQFLAHPQSKLTPTWWGRLHGSSATMALTCDARKVTLGMTYAQSSVTFRSHS